MRIYSLAFLLTLLNSFASAADFVPLQSGNRWTYRNAGTGVQFTVEVGSPVLIRERVYHMLRGYAPQPLLVRLDERKNLVQIDEDTNTEQVLTSFEPSDSALWQAPSRGCAQEGMTLERRNVFDGTAGPIPDVLEINYRIISCADIGTLHEQYAENIGMMRRTNTSIAGPQKFDLVYARVGNIQIDAMPHASFAVSAIDTPQSDYLTALLHLQSNSQVPLKLQFPTTQEFDVELRDEQGVVIWKWSDGQAFAAVVHETTVSAGWEMPIKIPWQQPGNYTIQAWLTTAGSTPYFAATVPIAITQ